MHMNGNSTLLQILLLLLTEGRAIEEVYAIAGAWYGAFWPQEDTRVWCSGRQRSLSLGSRELVSKEKARDDDEPFLEGAVVGFVVKVVCV